MNDILFLIISSIIFTQMIIYFNTNVRYKMNYIQNTKKFEQMFKKEMFIINKFYTNANKSIILSRNYTTASIYSKHEIKKKVYKNKCKVKEKFKKVHKKILVAIHSHSSLFYQRYVLRKIYKIYNYIQLLFFVGLDYDPDVNYVINEEMNLYKDIILLEFYNDYKNLHYLTYNFILWVKKYKHLYDIIIKQDTDAFLNINLLQTILSNKIRNESNFVLGHIWNYKDKENQYAIGPSYIFSSKSIDKLTLNIEKIYRKLFYGYAEDKFFGYLARQANFTFYDIFYNFHFKSFLDMPYKIIDINNTFMIHRLRICEIAYLHYIIYNIKYTSV